MSERHFLKPVRVLQVATAVALLCAATACSSGSDKSTPTSTSGKTITTLDGPPKTLNTVDGSHVPDPCAFFGANELTKLFDNTPGKLVDKAGPILNGKSCTRNLQTGKVDYALVVSIQEGTATYAEKYILNAKHLDGLGDTAYVAKHSLGGGLIISFVRDDRTYTITYAKAGPQMTSVPDPSDQSDALLALIRTKVN